jgi:hypothetical protein
MYDCRERGNTQAERSEGIVTPGPEDENEDSWDGDCRLHTPGGGLACLALDRGPAPMILFRAGVSNLTNQSGEGAKAR